MKAWALNLYWNDAFVECESTGGQLITLDTEKKNQAAMTYVTSIAPDHYGKSDITISLNSILLSAEKGEGQHCRGGIPSY